MEVWSQRLSSGEQQRLALARALLMRPGWLFLDESTSAVDERLEAQLYAVLARRLPGTTIMSIGHRSAVVGLRQRHLEMTPEVDRFTLRDAANVAAAGQYRRRSLRSCSQPSADKEIMASRMARCLTA